MPQGRADPVPEALCSLGWASEAEWRLLVTLGWGRADGGQHTPLPLRSFWSTVVMQGQPWGQGHRKPQGFVRGPVTGRHSTASVGWSPPSLPWRQTCVASIGDSHALWLLAGFGQAAGRVGDQSREASDVTVPPLGSLPLWVTTGWTYPC